MVLLLSLALVLNISNVSAANGNNSTTLNQQVTSQVNSQITYTPNEVNDAASRVKNFYETNKRLPNYVTIKNTQVTMPQFLNLLTTDLIQTNQGSKAPIPLKNVGEPLKPTGATKGGTLTKTEYINVAQTIKNMIDATGKAPDNANSPIGQIKYETLIYTFSKIMNFHKTKGRLPNYVTVPSNGYLAQAQLQRQSQTQNQIRNQTQSQTQTQNQIRNQTQISYTLVEVNDAASRVKNFYETNKRLPNYVTIKNTQVTMPQFLNLLTTDLIQTNQGSKAPIPLKNVGEPLKPTGATKGGTLTKTEYINVAQTIKNMIDATGKAPDNANSPIGQIKYETLIYTFSKIMNFHKTKGRLPNYVTVPSNGGNGGSGTTNFGKGQLNGLQGIEGLQILAAYINKNLNHQYGAATTAEGVERT
ncbi:MAG: pseudomurein-binding repeat-containing protein, partial [Methanobacteriales archaeon]